MDRPYYMLSRSDEVKVNNLLAEYGVELLVCRRCRRLHMDINHKSCEGCGFSDDRRVPRIVLFGYCVRYRREDDSRQLFRNKTSTIGITVF